MQKHLKVIFIGGLENGKVVFDYLSTNKYVSIFFAITYPDDSLLPTGENIIRSGTIQGFTQKIREATPDLIIVAGWSELIPNEILSIPNMGVIGFHPSRLPADRGRSVLAWQLAEGYTETALTMFYYSEYPDGGDIIAQERIEISENDYIGDVMKKVVAATRNLISAYFPLIRQGLAVRRPQDLARGNFRRLRRDKDSEIDWNMDSKSIYNLIRAISHPYPGATAVFDGRKMLIWRAEILSDFPYGKTVKPGTVVAMLYDETFVVRTRDGFIRVVETETKAPLQ